MTSVEKVKMEEQKHAYINASMFDKLPRTRLHRDRSSTNSESSLVALDSPNPLYQMGCSRPTSKDLYCTIPEQHPLKTAKLRKRANKKDLCFSRVVLFLVMLIALTSFVMVLLIMLRKVGPDCLCTTESPRQRTLDEQENVLVIRKELYELKENIQLYKSKVNNLTREIRTIRHKPLTGNQSSQCTCPPGPTGPQGKQGPVGPRGPPGYNGTVMETKQNNYSMALNSSLCQYEFKSSISHTSDHLTETFCSIRADEHKGFQITGITCSTKFADEYYLYTEVDPASNITIYNCRCLGSSQHTNPQKLYPVKCYLHYWICRIAI